MKLQSICKQYAAFRRALGERFEVNGRHLKAFCRAMGQNIDIKNVSPEKVNAFLVGTGPLTTSWYVRHNALLLSVCHQSRLCRKVPVAACRP
jgi:integrase/recombinase XerD